MTRCILVGREGILWIDRYMMELKLVPDTAPPIESSPLETSTEPMELSEQFCPNLACCARGKRGQGTIIIHDRKRQRYRCKVCKQTFRTRPGTMCACLRKPMDLIVIVVMLLWYGCPVQ